jgi:deoxyribose-phosphate aldolase
MRDACGDAHIKVILATGECGTMQKVMQASLVCMMAGADFIKTSTGKEGVNATFETGFCMVCLLHWLLVLFYNCFHLILFSL